MAIWYYSVNVRILKQVKETNGLIINVIKLHSTFFMGETFGELSSGVFDHTFSSKIFARVTFPVVGNVKHL